MERDKTSINPGKTLEQSTRTARKFVKYALKEAAEKNPSTSTVKLLVKKVLKKT